MLITNSDDVNDEEERANAGNIQLIDPNFKQSHCMCVCVCCITLYFI